MIDSIIVQVHLSRIHYIIICNIHKNPTRLPITQAFFFLQCQLHCYSHQSSFFLWFKIQRSVYLISPLTIIPNLEHKASASSIEWVVRIAPLLPCIRWKGNNIPCIIFQPMYKIETWKEAEIVFQRNLFDCGSMPVLGSSMRTMAGRPSMDMA